MTKLTKPVIRATNRFHRAEEIIVELQPGFLVVRLKGKRSSRHVIDYDGLYEKLAWYDARQAAAEKTIAKARRKQR